MTKKLKIIMVFLIFIFSSVMKVNAADGKEVAFKLLDLSTWSDEFKLGISLAGIILIFIINFIIRNFEKNFYDDTMNTIVGGIWGMSAFMTVGLLIPSAKPLVEKVCGALFNVGTITMPERGSLWYIIILGVFALLTLAIWIFVSLASGENFIKAALLVIPLGMINAITLYFFIGIAIRMVLLAIGCGIVYSIFSNNGEKPVSNEVVEVVELRSGDYTEFYNVEHSVSNDELHIRSQNGGSTFVVHSVGDNRYMDNNGKVYLIDKIVNK